MRTPEFSYVYGSDRREFSGSASFCGANCFGSLSPVVCDGVVCWRGDDALGIVCPPVWVVLCLVGSNFPVPRVFVG